MPRLFVEVDPAHPERAALDAEGARHLRALRIPVGGSLEAVVGPGRVRTAVVESIHRRGAMLRLGEPVEGASSADPERETILVVALADLGRFDSVIEKATELGATAVLPFRAARSQIATVGEARRERWRRIARAACEQCGRTRPPEIDAEVDLSDLTSHLPPGTYRVVLTPGAERPWDGAAPGDRPLALIVGPEGGLAPEELAALIGAGAEARRLGPRILRFETAAIAALTIAGLGGSHLE